MPATTPVYALPYPLPTDQVAQGAADIQALAQKIEANEVATVASLPANPPDGLRVRLPAQGYVGVLGTYWDLVAYGGYWFPIGDCWLYNEDLAAITVAGSYQEFGPTIPIPATGCYEMTVSMFVDGSAGLGTGYMTAWSDGGGAPVDDHNALALLGHSGYGGGEPFQQSGSLTLAGYASGNIRCSYRGSGAGGAGIKWRRLMVRALCIYPPALELSEDGLPAERPAEPSAYRGQEPQPEPK